MWACLTACAMVCSMNTKYIVAGIIILSVVIFGGYYVFVNYPATESQTQDQTTETADTVQVQDVTIGDGAEATPGSVVSILYVGMLEDGTVFDSSEVHDNEPLIFVLGNPELIPGFQIGINGMREGGERALVIPPSLGYGAQEKRGPEGELIIPADATLRFSIKLISVTASETTGAEDPSEQ